MLPTFRFVMCLWLAGEAARARRIAQDLANSLSDRISHCSGDTWAQAVSRCCWCYILSGNPRNARITLQRAFASTEREQLSETGRAELQIASWLLNSRDALAQAQMMSTGCTLASRLLHSNSTENLRSVFEELSAYVRGAEVPASSDTWHHTILKNLRERLSLEA